MSKKKEKDEKPKVNPELEGFDIQVNSFGEIITNYDINKINEFLNKNVDDKKLRDRSGTYGEGKEAGKPDPEKGSSDEEE